MSLEQLSWLSQIVGSVGVVLSLLFVASQIRQNTRALARGEHNSTMAQWTVIRQAIVSDRRIAELMSDGLSGALTLDGPDQLRVENMLQEYLWACFHIWDRTQRGVFPRGTFEASNGALLTQLLLSPVGSAWWRWARHVAFVPAFVVDVDAVLALAAPDVQQKPVPVPA
jgi:hypothetical protein